MFRNCFSHWKKKKSHSCSAGRSTTRPSKQDLDKDLEDYWGKARKRDAVVGEPVEPGPKRRIIMVDPKEITHARQLINDGYFTDGVLHQTSRGQHIWYEKVEELPVSKTVVEAVVPCSPDDDKKGEYFWKRVTIEEELPEHQQCGWIARQICTRTNRIWVCKLKTASYELPALRVGESVFYEHRVHGWLRLLVLKVDHAGAQDGGASYVVGGAPQLDGAEIETERSRLFRKMPTCV